MKNNPIIIAVLIFILLTVAGHTSFSQPVDEHLDRIKMFKEMYNFDKWEGETGIVISGIPVTVDVFPQLDRMNKVWPKDNFTLENRENTDYIKIRKWWRSNREEVLVTMIVSPSNDAAKEYLISYYSDTQEMKPTIKEPGSNFDLKVGNVCFVDFNRENEDLSSIEFIRHNVLFMVQAKGRIQADLGKIAETIDAQLLRKTSVENIKNHPENPRILKLSPEKDEINIGDKIGINMAVQNETDGELRYFWNMTGGGISKNYLDEFIYYGGDRGKHEITLTVVNELGLYDTATTTVDVE